VDSRAYVKQSSHSGPCVHVGNEGRRGQARVRVGNKGRVATWARLVIRAWEGTWHRDGAGVLTDATSERPGASASVVTEEKTPDNTVCLGHV
jgi:hypothetical protein